MYNNVIVWYYVFEFGYFDIEKIVYFYEEVFKSVFIEEYCVFIVW